MLLPLVPLLPDFTARRVEAEQGLESGVGLFGLVGPKVTVYQELPRREQFGIEPDRLAARPDGSGQVSSLGVGLSHRRMIFRAQGV